MKYISLTIVFLLSLSTLSAQGFELGPFTGDALSLPVIGDFDGDDKDDILSVTRFFSATGDLTLHRSTSLPDSIMFDSEDLDLSAKGNPAAGDFDSDGDLDFVVVESDNEQIVIGFNNGNGTFEYVTLNSETAFGFYTGDMDNDGDVDIVSLNVDGRSVYLLTNDGLGGFSTEALLSNFSDLETLELNDIDNDGDLDVIIAVDEFSSSYIFQLENNGSGSFSQKTIAQNISNSIENIQVIDINKDGVKDVLYSKSSSSALSGLLGNDNGEYDVELIVIGEGTLRSFAVEDYNTDGIWDIMLGCNSDDNTFHLGLSNTELTYEKEVVSGVRPMFYIENGDFDSDGDLDVVLSNGDFWWATNKLEQFSVSVIDQEGIELNIYPNPFTSSISIKYDNSIEEILIFDLSGKIVYQSDIIGQIHNLNHLPSGIYNLSLFSIGKTLVQSSQIIKR